MYMNDKLTKNLDKYRKLISMCSGKECEGVFQKVVDSYEDDLLECEEFPPSYFEFVVDQLSLKEVFTKPGLWNFLMVLSTEQGKLQPQHYGALADCFLRNYQAYEDTDLCLAVCDFVARNYSTPEARYLLGKLGEIESKKPKELQGFVSDGFIIVTAEEKRAQEASTKH